MTCPSCGEPHKDAVSHCTHCGIGITSRSVRIAQVIGNLGWLARRSLGGFFSGGVAWLLAIAVARTLYFSENGQLGLASVMDFFPGKNFASAAVAAAILGSVGGMIERSAYKAILGGFLGAAGGLLGGLIYPYFENFFQAHTVFAHAFSVASSWAVASGLIGLASGVLEGTKKKIAIGLLGGLLGGALGGGISSQVYGAILVNMGSAEKMSWSMGRLLEFLAGGIAGTLIWFSIGLTEKFYIFRRRKLFSAEHKVCDRCSSENALNAWYCGHCGSALQEAASREQIRVTPYRGLERAANAFFFLAWLSSTVGVVATAVLFVSFIRENFLVALFGALLVALIFYIVSIVFRSLSESIRIGMKLTEERK